MSDFVNPSGGSASVASAINNTNQIVGWSTDAAGATRPFIWSVETVAELGGMTPNGYAHGVNNVGQVVGYGARFPSCGRAGPSLASFDEAVVWSNGTITDLGTLGGQSSSDF
jgi:probable HAF family extracellular repeat protein